MTKKAFPLIDLTYDFLQWSRGKIRKFPRHERNLGTRIESKAMDLLDDLLEARYCHDRSRILWKANLKLESIRFLFRMVRDSGLFDARRYEYVSEQMAEIGRQLGGWMKVQREQSDEKKR